MQRCARYQQITRQSPRWDLMATSPTGGTWSLSFGWKNRGVGIIFWLDGPPNEVVKLEGFSLSSLTQVNFKLPGKKSKKKKKNYSPADTNAPLVQVHGRQLHLFPESNWKKKKRNRTKDVPAATAEVGFVAIIFQFVGIVTFVSKWKWSNWLEWQWNRPKIQEILLKFYFWIFEFFWIF